VASNSKQETSAKDATRAGRVSAILQVGAIAATSALAGGIAVALWHRKTLSKLQNSSETPILPNSIDADDSEK
jgi:hypothetical protein